MAKLVKDQMLEDEMAKDEMVEDEVVWYHFGAILAFLAQNWFFFSSLSKNNWLKK